MMSDDAATPGASDPSPRKHTSALERARRDLASGRPDLARERITGYLYTLHRAGKYDANAYLLLGDACFAMHDFAKAGAAWLLTDKSGPDVEKAGEAFHRRFGRDPVNVLKQVKPHAPSEAYPPAVQERLKQWDYRYRPYRPRSNPHVLSEQTDDGDGRVRGVRPVELGCAVAAIIFVLLFVFWLFFMVRT